MKVMGLGLPELLRLFLIMSLTGSAIALFFFMIKPLIRERLPRAFQYYMWLAVYLALVLPLSNIVILPESSSLDGGVPFFMPIYDAAGWLYNTAAQMPARGQLLSVVEVLYFIWQSGTLAVLGFNIVRYLLFVRRLKKGNVDAEPQEGELLSRLSGGRRVPRLYRNPDMPTPILTGVFRPMIVLPERAYEEGTLQNILLHELTHFRRWDMLVKWVSVLLGAVYWWHPVLYFVRREMDRACELACDEAVIKRMDREGKRSYGDTLIAVAVDKAGKIALSTTMCEDKKVLRERLGAIMKQKSIHKGTIILSGALLLSVLCNIFLFCGAGRADSAGSGIRTVYAYEDLTSTEHLAHQKQIELRDALRELDENFLDAIVSLETSEDEILSATILITCREEMDDLAKKEEITQFVSESLNLDRSNITIDYVVLFQPKES